MAGHSHWAGIKHKKAIVDAKRGKLFSKLSKNIISAARSGGGNPDENLKLRYAIDKAKAVSMPNDNIERAIKKGTGELDTGETYEEVVYEGYGPNGAAVMIDILTDNRNRTAPEIRKIFETNGGQLGTTGSVAWIFTSKGMITVNAEDTDEEELLMAAVEGGAENMERAGEVFEITCAPSDFTGLRTALEEAGYSFEVAEVTNIPQNRVTVDAATAGKVMNLLEALDDHDDVQNVYTNVEFPEDFDPGE